METPAPAPPPPSPAADVVQQDPMGTGSSDTVSARSKRRGRNGLRIDLGGVSGGSGLNIAN